MPKSLADQVAGVVASVDSLRQFFIIFVSTAIPVVGGLLGFIARWITSTRGELLQQSRDQKADIENLKRDIWNRLNNDLQVIAGQDRDIKHLGDEVDRLRNVCEKNHTNGD